MRPVYKSVPRVCTCDWIQRNASGAKLKGERDVFRCSTIEGFCCEASEGRI